MKTILVLSSHVASSNVGGSLALKLGAAMGVEVVLVPTVVLGRHPGHGAPGGGAVSDEMFAGMLEGVVANGVLDRCNAILTGYFASPGQVEAAAKLIHQASLHDRQDDRPVVVVDPIMGDDGRGLYIRKDTADAILEKLAPEADILTPNAWEFAHGWNGGDPVEDVIPVCRAIAETGQRFLVTSIRRNGRIGVLMGAGTHLHMAATDILETTPPNGVGDLFTFLFTVWSLDLHLHIALSRAVGVVHETARSAIRNGRTELSLATLLFLLKDPPEAPVTLPGWRTEPRPEGSTGP